MLLDSVLADLTAAPEVIGNPWHGKLVMSADVYAAATLHLESGGTRAWYRPLSGTETVYLKAPDAPDAPANTADETTQGMSWRDYLLYGSVFPYSSSATGQMEGSDVFSRQPGRWLWMPAFGVLYQITLSAVSGLSYERIGQFGAGAPSHSGTLALTWPDGDIPDLMDLTTDGASALFYSFDRAVVRLDLSYAAGVVGASLSTVLARTSTQVPYMGAAINEDAIKSYKTLATYTQYTLGGSDETIVPCPPTSTVHHTPSFTSAVVLDPETGDPELYHAGYTIDYRYLVRPYFSATGIGYLWLEKSVDETVSNSETGTAEGYVASVCDCSGGGCTYTNNGIGGAWEKTEYYHIITTRTLLDGSTELLTRTVENTQETITTRAVTYTAGGGSYTIDLAAPDVTASDITTGNATLTPEIVSLYVTLALVSDGRYPITKSPLSGEQTLRAKETASEWLSHAYHPVTDELIVDPDNLIGWV